MFDLLFRWRKASKCKNLVRRLHCRLKFLKIKRESIVVNLRDQIAQILRNGEYETAFSRVEQLCKDQDLLIAYDLLESFCEFISIHFPYIRKHRDCPDDIKEAVSTLIYAAAWCGDLPELQPISRLFGWRYGHKFAKAAAESRPGSLVNSQIKDKLIQKSIPESVKQKLIDEIVEEYSIKSDNRFEPHTQKSVQSNESKWEGFIFKEEASQVNKYEDRKSICRCRSSREVDLNCSLYQPCYSNVVEIRDDFQDKKLRKRVSPDYQSEPSRRSNYSHVHPKLPDYDELAAKFNALKKQYQLQNKRK